MSSHCCTTHVAKQLPKPWPMGIGKYLPTQILAYQIVVAKVLVTVVLSWQLVATRRDYISPLSIRDAP